MPAIITDRARKDFVGRYDQTPVDAYSRSLPVHRDQRNTPYPADRSCGCEVVNRASSMLIVTEKLIRTRISEGRPIEGVGLPIHGFRHDRYRPVEQHASAGLPDHQVRLHNG